MICYGCGKEVKEHEFTLSVAEEGVDLNMTCSACGYIEEAHVSFEDFESADGGE